MDADAELDAALGRHAGVALDHAVLHLDRAAHRVDHAAELDEAAVAGALDDAPVMRGDGGVDQVAAQAPEARQRAILVRAGEPAVADHVGDEDRCNLPGLAHGRSSAGCEPSTKTGRNPGNPIAERDGWTDGNSQAPFTLTLRSRAKRGVSKGEGVSLRQRVSFEALCLQQRAPQDGDGGNRPVTRPGLGSYKSDAEDQTRNAIRPAAPARGRCRAA